MARDRDDFDDRDDDRPREPRENVPNYLAQSIFSTLCCCLPLGIVAIVNAAKVNSLVAAGDYRAAREASAAAKKWSTISIVLGLVGNVILVILQVLAAAGAQQQGAAP